MRKIRVDGGVKGIRSLSHTKLPIVQFAVMPKHLVVADSLRAQSRAVLRLRDRRRKIMRQSLRHGRACRELLPCRDSSLPLLCFITFCIASAMDRPYLLPRKVGTERDGVVQSSQQANIERHAGPEKPSFWQKHGAGRPGSHRPTRCKHSDPTSSATEPSSPPVDGLVP